MQKMLNSSIGKLYGKLEGWFESFVKMLPNLIIAILVIVFFWILSKFVYRWISKGLEKTNFNRSLEHLVANICRIIVILVGFVLALAVMELQKTVFSLLAGVGVVGLALGFAFQDLASNFIAGIMIAIRAPMKIDELIEIGDTTGTVVEIRLRDTLIKNFDGQHVFVPNKDFTTNRFKNYSSFGKRKIKVEVGIGYEDDPREALNIIKKSLTSVDDVLDDPAPEVYVDNLGGSSVNLIAHLWFKYPGGNFAQIKNDATIVVKEELEKANFNLPFPTRTLDVPDDLIDKINKSKADSREA